MLINSTQDRRASAVAVNRNTSKTLGSSKVALETLPYKSVKSSQLLKAYYVSFLGTKNKAVTSNINPACKKVAFKGGVGYFEKLVFDHPINSELSFDKLIAGHLADPEKKARFIDFIATKVGKTVKTIKEEISPQNTEKSPLSEVIQGSFLHKEAQTKRTNRLLEINSESEQDLKKTLAKIKEVIGDALFASYSKKDIKTATELKEVSFTSAEELALNNTVNKTLESIVGGSFGVHSGSKQSTRVGQRTNAGLFNAGVSSSIDSTDESYLGMDARLTENIKNELSTSIRTLAGMKKNNSKKEMAQMTKSIETTEKFVNIHRAAPLKADWDVRESIRAKEREEAESAYKESLENSKISFKLKELLLHKKTFHSEIAAVAHNNEHFYSSLASEHNGDEHFEQNKFKMALSYYNDALNSRASFLNTCKDIKPQEDKTLGNLFHKAGDTLLRLQNYEGAINHYNKALEIRTCIDDPEASTTYNRLGDIYFKLGNAHFIKGSKDEADAYYEKSRRLYSKVETSSNASNLIKLQAANSTNLVRLTQGNAEQSDHHILTGNLQRRIDPAEAINHYFKALKIVEEQKGGDSLEAGKLHLELSKLHSQQGNLTSAVDHLSSAIPILEKKEDRPCHKERKELSSMAKIVGDDFYDKFKFDKAAKYYDLFINSGIEHSADEYYPVLKKAADSHFQAEDLAPAKSYYRKYSPYLACSQGLQNSEYLQIMQNLGRIYYKTRDILNARNCYESALNISQSIKGEDHEITKKIKNILSLIKPKNENSN